MRVAVIGGGIGGMAAAIRLADLGHTVQLFEARPTPGGLASTVEAGGEKFDGGPYILLDRPGLEWAFEKLGIDVGALPLHRVEELYEVAEGDRLPVRIALDLERTSAQMEERWPGVGARYRRFVGEMETIRQRLTPILRVPHPNVLALARRGALSTVPFLLRSLGGVLDRAALPREVIDAIGIWTHIAGQPLHHSPSVMAFVPALIHHAGAFYPERGLAQIPRLLEAAAHEKGVTINCGTPVRSVRTRSERVTAVELESGEVIECDAVISNYHGVGTYAELVEGVPARVRAKVRTIPLQSPGVCAYLRARGSTRLPYLRFRKSEGRVALLISPAIANPTLEGERFPLRLLMPIDHDEAMRRGEAGQQEQIEAMLAENWWREGVEDHEVVATRTVRAWGQEMHLYRDSMNPAMTRRMMLQGRMPHRSRSIRGLYLAGASTHPGQWVSFCAMSGVMAAEQLHEDR